MQTTVLQKEQQRLSVAEDLASRYQRVTDTFDDLLYKLRYGEFTQKTPIDNIAGLRDLVKSTGSKAALGDVGAQEQLGQILPDFIRLSEEVYGGNAQFGADLQLANDLADKTQSVAQRQLQIQTDIANSARAQLSVLEQLANGGGLAKDQRFLTGDFSGNSFSKSNPNRILVRALKAGAVDRSQFEALQRAAGFYGNFEQGRAGQFFEENTVAAGLLASALQSAGLDKYAGGGQVRGGVRDRDSVPVMTMPGEYIINKPSASRIGFSSLAYMNATGSVPRAANDDQLAELNQRIAGLTQVVAQMGARLTQLQERTARATESTAGNARLQAWSS